MRRIAPNIKRRWKTHHTAAAMMAASTTTTWLYLENYDEWDEHDWHEHNWHENAWQHTSFLDRIFPQSQKTSCHFLMMGPPSTQRSGGLKRRQTVELMEATATTGDTLDHKYKVQWHRPLGEGTYGAVFLGKSRDTDELVAIKKISKHFTDDATFQREMNALMAVRDAGGHVNICTCREHFEEGGYFYLVLDLIEGGEMFDQLCDYGAYSEADAARLIRQVASCLAFLHGLGITHSDLKPENLMLSTKNTDDAAIKLVDFGCCHTANAAVNDHEHRGTASTPAYCPPEVLKVCREEHAKIEPSFDMWSLGVIVYVMLTGSHPFDLEGTKTDDQIEKEIISGKTPPIRDSPFTEHLSQDAIDLMEGLINWDPSKRLTADQLLENRWVRGETASSKKIPASDSRLRHYRKHKTRVATSFFRSMLVHSDTQGGSEGARRTSLLEAAFRQLDKGGRGYVSTKEMNGDTSLFGEDAKLSFSEISDLLSEHMTNRYFPKDFVVYKEGDKGDSMYFINSGSVQVTSDEGFSKTRHAGEFFGEDALMSKEKKHSNEVRCTTHVHAIEISREYFEKYVKADQDVELTMAETDRLRKRERAKTILGLQKNMVTTEFKKGDVIFEKGREGDMLYILEKGQVEISVDGHKVRTLKPGEMTGEHAAFYGNKPYNVTAKCASNSCKMGALRSKDMHELFRKNPSLRESFYDIILRRDFKKAVCAATKRRFPETEEELRVAFDKLDDNNSGELELDKLRRIMLKFDPTYTDEEVRNLLTSLDLNKSGSLTWAEFKQIFGMAKEA